MPITPNKIEVNDGERSVTITDPTKVIDNLVDSLPAFIWTSGPGKECTYFNRNWLDYRGRTLEQELIDGFTFGIHPEDVNQTIEAYLYAFDNRFLYESEYRIKNAIGEYHWVLDRGMPVYGKDSDEFLGYAGICIDIDARKSLEYQLRRSQELLTEQNDSLRLINQLSTRLQGCSDAQQSIAETLMTMQNFSELKYASIQATVDSSISGKSYVVKRHIGSAMRQNGIDIHQSISNELNLQDELVFCDDVARESSLSPEVRRVLQKAGIKVLVTVPLRYQDSNLGSIVMGFAYARTFRDSEFHSIESIGRTLSLSLTNISVRNELEHRADHDSLTGLGNRAMLHKTFEAEMIMGQQKDAAMMLLDLDRFKEINDTLGHYMGDKVLRQIGPQIASLLEDNGGHLFRLGGDEFAILFFSKMSDKELVGLSTQIKERLCTPIQVEKIKVEIDASIGISRYPIDGRDSHELLKCADVAMYEAKSTGRGALLYWEEMNKYTQERFTMIADFGNSIRENELCLHFQPKYDYHQKQITGFESLVRWEHKTMGLLFPDSFIPLAEVSDIIHTLTEKVLELSLRQHKKWREQGYQYSVAVNLSARNLQDDRIVESLQRLMHKFDTPANQLELEITETALMTDPDLATEILQRIAKLGIRLLVDDFGTGYSSLAYLKRLPMYALKIDRTFVSDMLDNEQDEAIVRSTISLAHNLNLQVVAEGAENEETIEKLREMGCDMVQGYQIARPMPWNKLEKHMQQQRLSTES